MSKKANQWEVPVNPIFPYMQWHLQGGDLSDGGVNDWRSGRHNHATYEMYIILSGECSLFVNNIKLTLQTGQGIMIEPEVFHATDSVTQPFCRLSVGFRLGEDHLAQHLSGHGPFLLFKPDDTIMNLCHAISSEIRNESGLFHKELLSNQFSQLMLQVFRIMKETAAEPQLVISHPKQLDDMMVIDSFFVNTPPKQRSKENLARRLHCSERQVLRKIYTLYGMSFQKKQMLSRVDTAQHLLRVTDKSVEEICALVGYSDTAAFYKAFKHYTNTTPVKYRKRVKDIGNL